MGRYFNRLAKRSGLTAETLSGAHQSVKRIEGFDRGKNIDHSSLAVLEEVLVSDNANESKRVDRYEISHNINSRPENKVFHDNSDEVDSRHAHTNDEKNSVDHGMVESNKNTRQIDDSDRSLDRNGLASLYEPRSGRERPENRNANLSDLNHETHLAVSMDTTDKKGLISDSNGSHGLLSVPVKQVNANNEVKSSEMNLASDTEHDSQSKAKEDFDSVLIQHEHQVIDDEKISNPIYHALEASNIATPPLSFPLENNANMEVTNWSTPKPKNRDHEEQKRININIGKVTIDIRSENRVDELNQDHAGIIHHQNVRGKNEISDDGSAKLRRYHLRGL